MLFDADRLSRLAGLSTGSSRLLSEAGNRSQREDPGEPDDADYRWGKNQISERQGPAGEDEDNLVQYERQKYGGNKRDKSTTDPGDEDDTWRKDEMEDPEWLGEEEEGEEDVVLEIDEGLLRNEIRRMKSSRLAETKLRAAIRNEIHGIFSELGVGDHAVNSSWVYGDKKPRNSKNGAVVTSFPGIGFM